MSADGTPMSFPTSLGTSTADEIRLLGQDLTADLMGKVGFGELAFWLVAMRRPTPSETRVFEAVLVALADHGFTPTAIAVGVKPWSANATSTASKTRVCEGVGRRIATSQKASSPKPTFPIRSAARSCPSRRISSAVEVPSEVGKDSGRPSAVMPSAPSRRVPLATA